ncbi:type II toxin-antitoxin system RelE/ParE family toxin, partial [Mesorhizobium sp. M8A.F.Ca.ET.142.01.1.1]
MAAYILESGGSETAANGFIDRIRERCQSIGNGPRGGRLREDLMPGLRTVPFEHSALIAYVIEGDSVFIVNVFYGGRPDARRRSILKAAATPRAPHSRPAIQASPPLPDFSAHKRPSASPTYRASRHGS